MPQGTCTVDACAKPTRTPGSAMCGMHYHRLYRHGDVNRRATDGSVRLDRGGRYQSTTRPGHPLARKSGRVYTHRAVLYDAIGPGLHPCHWCSAQISWDSTIGDANCLNVDHLNGQRDDNRLENLVPACTSCNVTRGAQARSAALRAAGWWSKHDTVSKQRSGTRRAPIGPERAIKALTWVFSRPGP